MRILYFHQHFTPPNVAGGLRSYEFARQLIARGHSVTMVCGRPESLDLPPTNTPGMFRGVIDGIDVIQLDLPYSNYDNIARRTWIFLRFAWASVRLALHEPYDLLFATSTPLTAGIPGIVMKWFRRRRPFVFEVRDLWPELPMALGMRNPFLLGGMSLLEWLAYRVADGCVGLSPGICEGIRKRARADKPLVMIPNGCDLGLFRPGKRSDLNLEGIKQGDTVGIFTGAHGLANGLGAVLDAAAVLQRRGRSDIVFAFIGDGKMKPGLVDRAEREGLRNCRFYEPMPKNQLNRLVASADVGLMILANVPAFYYGTSPNKFFDYISSGLPVLNNYPGWLAEIIQRNRCGITVPPDDPDAFADAMVELADHPERRREMGRNARVLAERDFDRNRLSQQFADFLESMGRQTV